MSFRSSAIYTSAVKVTAPAIAVVTGGKSGIGLAIARKIASFPFVDQVLAVSRSITAGDLPTGQESDRKITPLAADVGTVEGRKAIEEAVERLCGSDPKQRQRQLRFLVHSAGVIDPIKPVLELEPTELRRAMNINCEAPLFLTTSLYPYMIGDEVSGRVLHVSSGAAHGAPPVGWSVYGISKAAFFQSFKVLEREFREAGGKVVVGSFKPGVVDTPVQGTIRESSESSMPIVQNFRNMKEKASQLEEEKVAPGARPPPKGALDTPENVAFFAEYLLMGTTD